MMQNLLQFLDESVWRDDAGVWRFRSRSFRRKGQARKAALIEYMRLLND